MIDLLKSQLSERQLTTTEISAAAGLLRTNMESVEEVRGEEKP